jgi:hypothetical protein
MNACRKEIKKIVLDVRNMNQKRRGRARAICRLLYLGVEISQVTHPFGIWLYMKGPMLMALNSYLYLFFEKKMRINALGVHHRHWPTSLIG